jgi:hypothetical protein
VSPSLNKTYGGEFGVQGAPYASPDGTFILSANADLDVLSIIKPSPSSTGANTTQILEIPMTGGPGSILFVPKNTSVTYGDDTDPRDYYAVIGLGEQSTSSGVAFLDMATVVAGFSAGLTELPSSSVEYVYVGASPDSESRNVVRGMGYIVTAIYDTTLGKATKIAFIDETTRKLVKTMTIGSGSENVQKLLFVPIHTDELTYQLTQAQSQLTAVQEQRHTNVVSHRYSIYGIVIGSVALTIAVTLLTVLITMSILGLSSESPVVLQSKHKQQQQQQLEQEQEQGRKESGHSYYAEEVEAHHQHEPTEVAGASNTKA